MENDKRPLVVLFLADLVYPSYIGQLERRDGNVYILDQAYLLEWNEAGPDVRLLLRSVCSAKVGVRINVQAMAAVEVSDLGARKDFWRGVHQKAQEELKEDPEVNTYPSAGELPS